jgi:sigma-B regulation protein RsbU (phosphoserine phosphatase)
MRADMAPWTITIVAIDGSRDIAHALRDRLDRAWPSETPAQFTVTMLDDLDQAGQARLDAIVVCLTGDPPRARLRSHLGELDEAGVAMMVLTPEPESLRDFGNAMVEAIECDDALLCAKLQGMLHRQPTVSALRRDVSLAQRFHGGLQGEIARMHEEMQLAAMVQREFLPRELPELYGVEFAALWRPAHYVSGDIYDVARLDNDHIGVFLADAVGHGVPAALMTMVICRSLTTKIITGNLYHIVEPCEVLSSLNHDMIRRQGRSTRFATAVYAVINCRTRMVKLAGAGHPPPLLMRVDGEVEMIESSGGLLGVFKDESYEQVNLEMHLGDRLVLYSDGFEQAFPVKGHDSYERRLPTTRYREEFAQLAEQPTPTDMIATISQRLDDQSGSLHQVDDLTMICMHTGPLAAATDSDRDARRQEIEALRARTG